MSTTYEEQLEKIYEKYKVLKAEAANDCQIDRTELFSPFNTKILMNWINKKTEWNRLYKIYEEARKKQFRDLYEYYRTEFHLKLTTKDEYQLYIESDTKYILLNNLSLTTKEILSYIDSILDAIKSRQWEIKNYIEYQKFKNGII